MNAIKTRNILASLIIFLGLTGALFGLSTVQAANEQQNAVCQGSTLKINTVDGGECARISSDVGGKKADDKANDLVAQIVNIFSVLVGIVAVIMIIYGGFRYVTSGGDSGRITGAKNTLLYAIIGLVIVALAQVIVKFVLAKVTSTT